jgi:hypothetical protein
MTTATNNPSFVEHYLTIGLSESQYQVLEKVSKVKAMSIQDLHFAKNKTAKDRLLEGLQKSDESCGN